MKAVYFEEQGGLELLKYGELPTPRPKAGEALVRVKAAALNHLDLHLRNGTLKVQLPHVSGTDVSGVVAEINGSSQYRVGNEVVINPAIPCGQCDRCKKGLSCEIVKIFGYKTWGGFAEYVIVPIGQLYPKPANLSFIEAAAFPLTFLTAWHMLVGRADVQKGETVFIWGASGGLGAAAIQIANYLGAKTIAAAGSEADATKIKAFGADEVAVYTRENMIDEVKALNDDKLVDVVFESVGARTWQRTLALLRPYGRVVIAGTTSGAVASQDLSDIYYYQQTILGSRMGNPDEFAQVVELMTAGKLKLYIDKVFSLSEFAQAEQYLEDSQQMGKVVLEV